MVNKFSLGTERIRTNSKRDQKAKSQIVIAKPITTKVLTKKEI